MCGLDDCLGIGTELERGQTPTKKSSAGGCGVLVGSWKRLKAYCYLTAWETKSRRNSNYVFTPVRPILLPVRNILFRFRLLLSIYSHAVACFCVTCAEHIAICSNTGLLSQEEKSVTRVQNLEEAVCTSLHSKYHKERYESIYLPHING